MKIEITVFCVMLVACVCAQNQLQRAYQFEDLLTSEQQSFKKIRSQSAYNGTLYIQDTAGTNSMDFLICLKPVASHDNVTFSLYDIQYSNDGDNDNVTITFNGTEFATFTTEGKSGDGTGWDVFRNSGKLGSTLVLPEGNYSLSVSVTTDQWGVELDQIRVYAEYHDTIIDLFCGENSFTDS